MNKVRKKELKVALDYMQLAHDKIEVLKYKESDVIDSYPENLQDTDAYEAMENAYDAMDEALDYLSDAISEISSIL